MSLAQGQGIPIFLSLPIDKQFELRRPRWPPLPIANAQLAVIKMGCKMNPALRRDHFIRPGLLRLIFHRLRFRICAPHSSPDHAKLCFWRDCVNKDINLANRLGVHCGIGCLMPQRVCPRVEQERLRIRRELPRDVIINVVFDGFQSRDGFTNGSMVDDTKADSR